MESGDFGADCENCQCLTCTQNDDAKCQNCNMCNGDIGYDKWMMDCEEYIECKNPDETIKTILDNVKS